MISKLQIISGKYRGKKLAIPASARPTQQRTRAAIFNILNSLDNKKMETFSVWDAFAGSGAMGVEFISRFMPQLAVFTDTDQNAISSIRENTKSIADCSVIIKKMNAIDFDLAEIKNPVIVFIDPPYSESNSGCQLVKKIGLSANVGTLVVWEMENDFNLDEKILNGFSILKDRTYGRARFVIIERN